MTLFGWILCAYLVLCALTMVGRIGTVRTKSDAMWAVIEVPIWIIAILVWGTGHGL